MFAATNTCDDDNTTCDDDDVTLLSKKFNLYSPKKGWMNVYTIYTNFNFLSLKPFFLSRVLSIQAYNTYTSMYVYVVYMDSNNNITATFTSVSKATTATTFSSTLKHFTKS
ncbi:unnamed protein product [Orchesella dallaii]|uniref:Uncharacterized protein n=1 Tax=Orchesella dallaii TaxID=48710 RepID=A0ABP1S315_9HEXA